MMERLLARGREIGVRRVEMMMALVEQAARDELPADIGVERIEGGVALFGRRIAVRLLGDARLRGLAALVRGLGA
jgi:hypothetical protein